MESCPFLQRTVVKKTNLWFDFAELDNSQLCKLCEMRKIRLSSDKAKAEEQ